jgi:HJR/Mrr/RecB family endonuclease
MGTHRAPRCLAKLPLPEATDLVGLTLPIADPAPPTVRSPDPWLAPRVGRLRRGCSTGATTYDGSIGFAVYVRIRSLPRRPNSVDRLGSRLAVLHPFVGLVIVDVTLVTTVVLAAAGPGSLRDRLIVGFAGGMWTNLFVVLWLYALRERRDAQRLMESTTNLEEVRRLRADEFEELVMAAYRHSGDTVTRLSADPGPDGGVDLVVQRGGRRILVQCKRWREWQVDVRLVREVAGIVATDGADGGVIVTCGTFSPRARHFASRAHVELIDGVGLVDFLNAVRSRSMKNPVGLEAMDGGHTPCVLDTPPSCPRCAGEMEWIRVYSSFWRCRGYPSCDGRLRRRPVDADRAEAPRARSTAAFKSGPAASALARGAQPGPGPRRG